MSKTRKTCIIHWTRWELETCGSAINIYEYIRIYDYTITRIKFVDSTSTICCINKGEIYKFRICAGRLRMHKTTELNRRYPMNA